MNSQATLPVLMFFRQEGWRLEHENPTDPQTPLVFKGVVFNEMKGAFVSFVHFFFFFRFSTQLQLQVINSIIAPEISVLPLCILSLSKDKTVTCLFLKVAY